MSDAAVHEICQLVLTIGGWCLFLFIVAVFLGAFDA